MSRDLPEVHADPMAMARCLVTYISDPRKVNQYVKAEFGSSPGVSRIRELRESFEKPGAYIEPFKPHDWFSPMDAYEKMAEANSRFLKLLQIERERIAAVKLAQIEAKSRVPEAEQ